MEEGNGFTALMEVLTGTMCSYLEWCSLCLAGINCSLIRCHWDLWEEELFSWCQVLSYCSVCSMRTVTLLQLLKTQSSQKTSTLWAETILVQCTFCPYICISCSFPCNLPSHFPELVSTWKQWAFACCSQYLNLCNRVVQYEEAESVYPLETFQSIVLFGQTNLFLYCKTDHCVFWPIIKTFYHSTIVQFQKRRAFIL